jgi:hypothetical protein
MFCRSLRARVFQALVVTAALAGFVSPALSQDTAPPGGQYKKVSELVKLPDFLPGLGQLFVDPSTLPAGPFLAYDHDGKLVSTIYMIPVEDLNPQKVRQPRRSRREHRPCDVYFNAGHPGVEKPHAHVVLWHVPAADEAKVAK